jgi:hypothetical protein
MIECAEDGFDASDERRCGEKEKRRSFQMVGWEKVKISLVSGAEGCFVPSNRM